MEKIYGISVGQIVTLWVFGVIGMLALTDYSFYPLAGFLSWLLPLILVFYTVGWWKQRYGHLRLGRRFFSYLEDKIFDLLFSRTFWLWVFVVLGTAIVTFVLDSSNFFSDYGLQ